MAFSVSYYHKKLFLRCRRHSGSASDAFIVKFEYISHLFVGFISLTLSKLMFFGYIEKVKLKVSNNLIKTITLPVNSLFGRNQEFASNCCNISDSVLHKLHENSLHFHINQKSAKQQSTSEIKY